MKIEGNKMCSMSEMQKRIVGYGVTSLGVLCIILLVSVLAVLCWFAGRLLHSVLEPLTLGVLLSCVFATPFEKARRLITFGKCKELSDIRKDEATDWAGLVVFVLFMAIILGLIVAVVYLVGSFVVGQFVSLGSNFPVLGENLLKHTPWLRDLLMTSGIDVQDMLKKIPSYFLAHTNSLLSIKDLISTWVFAVIFSYCFLENPVRGHMIGDELKWVPMFSGEGVQFFEKQFDRFCDTMTSYFPKQLIINFVIEGLAAGLGLMLIGVPFGFVLGFLMGALNLIPFYGTIAVLPVLLLAARFGDGGSIGLMVESLVIWLLVQIADFLLPMCMHGKMPMNGKPTKLSAGVIIFSFLFWGVVISPVWGMILAIPLSAFTKQLWDSVKELLVRSKKRQFEKGDSNEH